MDGEIDKKGGARYERESCFDSKKRGESSYAEGSNIHCANQNAS
jgi:hypothetical protein